MTSEDENVKFFSSLSSFFKKIENELEKIDKIFIIGGERLYKIGVKICKKLYISEISKNFSCDKFFPRFDKTLYNQILLSSNYENNIYFECLLYTKKN